jgi:hypothetical protein
MRRAAWSNRRHEFNLPGRVTLSRLGISVAWGTSDDNEDQSVPIEIEGEK